MVGSFRQSLLLRCESFCFNLAVNLRLSGIEHVPEQFSRNIKSNGSEGQEQDSKPINSSCCENMRHDTGQVEVLAGTSTFSDVLSRQGQKQRMSLVENINSNNG